MSARALGLAAIAAAAGFVSPPAADVLPYGLKIEQVLSNAAEIGDIAQSPTGEIWILERTSGTVRLLVAGTEVASLVVPVRTTCESGLLDLAFSPDYARSGRAFISFVDPDGTMRVDEIFRTASGLDAGVNLLVAGVTPGCRPGGGLAIGPDGKLSVGRGDLEDSSAASRLNRLPGKLLRLELDGSIPADNPDPLNPVFARGLRNPTDLDINPRTVPAHGTIYVADAGGLGSADGEINAVAESGHYGWSAVSGDSGGLFDDPLLSNPPPAGPEALVVIDGAGLGEDARDSLISACVANDELQQLFVTGADLDQLQSSRTFYDPAGDRDGVPDQFCPGELHALAEGGDGMLYAAGNSANPGIWRIYDDLPGPREVSPPGSPLPLTVARQGALLRLDWEALGDLDSGRPARHGGQRPEAYRIYEGTLPIGGADYDHEPLLDTDGLPAGSTRLTATVAPIAGSAYYLVSAQGDNLEGSTGLASSGAVRDSEQDYCGALGYGRFTGDCIDDFRHPVTGSPMKLTDYNPLSPTYLRQLSVRDFRGKVVHLDISANNCPWCNLQADTFHAVDLEFRDRDFILLTIFDQDLTGPFPYPTLDACAEAVADWVDRHDEHTPVLCDVDLNGDTLGDVARQFWHLAGQQEPCGGTPQNFFIDQGGVIFDYTCSFTPGPAVADKIGPEVNPESCE